ncbi:hypothetical protein [Streptomyces sp. W1SF4]|uniref:hypothetical protein n=1 Tax=Streptomyces sp. W1SF4 TaxID=2305220 RepID=UPI000F6CD65C|nr:hypothetical protein [Streptomyces sp. W1SF4]AZM87116.1 hypothetical protein D1J60_00090 [Streptomyces sp. W1SF4]
MKRHRVRSIAVFLVVLVALTGGRRSGGGGCDGHRSSGSGSDTAGGGHATTDSGGADPGSGPSSPSPSPRSTITYGENDVEVGECQLTAESDVLGRVRFAYRVTNGNTEASAAYAIRLAFLRTSDKQVLSITSVSIPHLAPGKTETGTITELAATRDNDMRTLAGHCIVSRVDKTGS